MPDSSTHYAELEHPTSVYVVSHQDKEVARSSSVVLLREHYAGKAMKPVPYFPSESLLVERAKTDKSTRCPIKGEASYWTLEGIADAAWSYENALEGVRAIQGYVAFDQRKGFEVRVES